MGSKIVNFLKGLVAAAVAGALAYFTDVSTYGPNHARNVALSGAIVGLAAYLKRSPIDTAKDKGPGQ